MDFSINELVAFINDLINEAEKNSLCQANDKLYTIRNILLDMMTKEEELKY